MALPLGTVSAGGRTTQNPNEVKVGFPRSRKGASGPLDKRCALGEMKVKLDSVHGVEVVAETLDATLEAFHSERLKVRERVLHSSRASR